ncbi:MAG TPA: N-acetylglucosamine-6-phosphate deacetylase, partial [Alphaproteobacteria bacterium]|nr:N-acetylglucosamine-6-phosphate deacetylase [Alphaproteobacteria bacterium]
FDGDEWHDRMALLVNDGVVEGLMAADSPSDAMRVPLDGGMLVPGFIDLQVNGGGGILLNDAPTLDGIRTICTAARPFGTTACLPTLITDTPAITDRAVEAGLAAAHAGLPGFLGLHLEGPHLSIARKGAHDPALIRPFSDNDLQRLIHARAGMPAVLTTVAPETVSPEEIAAIAGARVVVSIGHSDASYALAAAAAAAGATMVTHLFNAQSQMGHREPGVVGAALDIGSLYAGIIADGIHVHPAAIGNAVRGKRGPGRVFLVTDAMSVTGTTMETFTLNGRTVYRRDGALRLADGTLAGADLTMIGAIAFMHRTIGVELSEALRMASLYPAEAMGIDRSYGHLHRGARADMVHLSDGLEVRRTFIAGEEVFAA